MWPVILPLIGPLLGKLGLGLMVGAGGLLGGFLGAQLLKVPFVGKKMGPAVEKGIKDNFEKGGQSIQKAAESMGKDGKLEIPTGGEGGGGEGGAEEVESKDNLLEGGESLENTLKENGLIEGESLVNIEIELVMKKLILLMVRLMMEIKMKSILKVNLKREVMNFHLVKRVTQLLLLQNLKVKLDMIRKKRKLIFLVRRLL